jgi:hypothetical protein
MEMPCTLRHDIPEDDWARLDHGDDPFASRAFLGTAEKVGAGGTAMGWQAQHLALREGEVLLGCCRSTCAATPSATSRATGTGPRPGSAPGSPTTRSWSAASPIPPRRGRACWCGGHRKGSRGDGPDRGCRTEVTRQLGASSWQCLFVEGADRARLEAAGLLMRRGVQFHWFNRAYRDFDDFLAGFTADKRKKLKRERRAVAESGLCGWKPAWRRDRRGRSGGSSTASIATPLPATATTRPSLSSSLSKRVPCWPAAGGVRRLHG